MAWNRAVRRGGARPERPSLDLGVRVVDGHVTGRHYGIGNPRRAMHIAVLPGSVASLTVEDVHEFAGIPKDPEAVSREQIQAEFARSLSQAKEILRATDDQAARREIKLVMNGKTVFAAPRAAFWRTVLLNHNYHHRGQLSTYLRELDIPLPSIYGPSADTNPFA